jgi:ribosomal protein L29
MQFNMSTVNNDNKENNSVNKDLENIKSIIISKLENVKNMKKKLSLTKYSLSLTGNGNNIDIKKLRKAIARELTEINNIKRNIK